MSPAPRRRCGTMAVHEELVETNPSFRENQADINSYTLRSIETGEVQKVARKLIKIPVAVHVVYRRDRENVKLSQIQSQIGALNRDFRAKNTDRNKVPGPWKGLVGDSRIEFYLAKRDPSGKKTDGITRTETKRQAFSAFNDSVKKASTGGTPGWPRDRYLNIWVCNLEDGLLGYAQFPGGPARTDGVVITHTAFGTRGTAKRPFDRGRTATHEVGHWLNLRHIWGDTWDCSGTDRVPDTPNAKGPNYGKPNYPHITCNNGPQGDMFMNYMDYVDDAAMVMFSDGQIVRMNACLAGPRKKLGR
jgi:hypothetical protein